MAKATTDSFLATLRKSELIDAARLKELLSGLQESGVDLHAPTAVATALVKQGAITLWQAENLLRGKHRGYTLGKYRLLSLLGKGGMSSVYLAEHTLMRRRCAIKVLPAKRVGESSYLGRFHREAQAVASLDHPNIVRAYDVDHAADKGVDIHFLVMEYVEGRDLQEMVDDDGPLDFAQAVEYARQAADGLGHAHVSGLIHRDVKPANLLVDRNGVVKILDMGLARFFHEDDEKSLTVANDEKVLGTADYLAPEQAVDSHTADLRADVYGLGCALYFTLCGHPPFNEGTLTQRLMAHQTKDPKPIEEVRDGVPETLGPLLRKLMAKKPADRFQTMAEVVEATTEWLIANGASHLIAARVIGSPVGDSSVTKSRDSNGSDAAPPPTEERPRERDDQALSSFLTNLDSNVFKNPPSGTRTSGPGSSTARRETVVAPVLEAIVEPETEPENPFEIKVDERPRSGIAPPVVVDKAPEEIAPLAEAIAEPTSGILAEVVDEAEAPVQSVAYRRPQSRRRSRSNPFASLLEKKQTRIALAAVSGLLSLLLVVWLAGSFFGGGGDGKTGDSGTNGSGIDPKLRELEVGTGKHFATLGEAIDYLTERGASDRGRSHLGDNWTIRVAGGTTYKESLTIAEGFPAGVTFESTGDPAIIAPPAGDAPAVTIEGVEAFVLRGFEIKAGGHDSAVRVSGSCPGVRLENLVVHETGRVGVHCKSAYSIYGAERIVVEGCRFDGGEIGVLIESPSTDLTSSEIDVRNCRFAKIAKGILVKDAALSLGLRENTFSEVVTGIDFNLEPDQRQVYDVVVGNNSFHQTGTGIHFNAMPNDESTLVLARNLFVEPKTAEVVVATELNQGRIDNKFVTTGNWSSRPAPATPGAGEADVFSKEGQRGATFEFVSTAAGSQGFLQPKRTAPHAKVENPANDHELKPYIGAVAP